MKKRSKKLLVLLLTLVTVISNITIIKADDVKPYSVTKIISSHKTIRVGTEFELTAVTNPYDSDDDYLHWKIVGKKGIVSFTDNTDGDDEVELVALKVGKTKVRCYVRGKSKSYAKTITINVKKAKASKISRVGKKSITVEVDDDLELKVKKSGSLKNKDLKWTIKNKKLLRFEDGDRYGKEVELEALKTGKTTVTCKNLKTNKKVKYTVIIIPDYDD